jgi:hypothetical protein
MEDEKSDPPFFKNFEERLDQFWWSVVDRSEGVRPAYAAALLVKCIERLRVSTEESSHEANRLSSAIKKLTWAMVGLTAVAVVLAGLSLYSLLRTLN